MTANELVKKPPAIPPFAASNGSTARVDCNLCDECMDALKVDKTLAWMGHTDEGGGVMCDKCGRMQARLCFRVKHPACRAAQSKRRTLRNYYAAISMGIGNGRDADLGRRALDDLIRDNEAAIVTEEAQHDGGQR